jgi:hypothetical protein
MTVNVPASLLATAGPATLEAFNPTPGGGTSNSVSVEVRNPAPTVASVSPSTIPTAAPATLHVLGSGYVSTTFARWNGGTTGVTVSNITPTSLDVTLSDTLLTQSGTGSLEIVNAAPGGGSSGGVSIAIEHAVPVLSGVSPTTFGVGAPPATLTVTGSGFDAASVVAWNGTVLPRTLVNATTLTGFAPCGTRSRRPASIP